MKPFSIIGSAVRFATAALALAAPFNAYSQEYPAQDIHALCNYGPGSGADVIVRFYSDRLSKLTGKPVIVENKTGANGAIATDTLAKSKPDGYTILITPVSSTIVSAPYLFKNLPFDSTKDFTAVTTIAALSFTILVDAASPIKTVNDLIAHLKAKPNNGFYGTTNNTGVIAAELFKAKAGLKTTYAPYKQNPQALTDLLLGQLDFLAFDATWAKAQSGPGGKLPHRRGHLREALGGAAGRADTRRNRLRRRQRCAVVGRRSRRRNAPPHRGQARWLVQPDHRGRGHETVPRARGV